ncbi:MAG: TIR domain-containing protein [Clostridiales bacterium]|nr:TIR domain-containing protein [Clostridiales bacterium]
MDKNAIENPKVFISYAWGTDEYQEKVLTFATRLQREAGVEVIFDKWTMDAGNDTYAFMEKSVNDDTIHFVLILLDENYAEKADKRKGGVGTETQIISPEVYNKTKQTKFIPIIFERGADGAIYTPAYLKSLLYFDLTGNTEEAEFKRLVRHIYGVKTYPIPEKGKRPDWVDKAETIAVGFYAPLSKLDIEKNPKERRKISKIIFDDIIKSVMAIEVPSVWDNSGQTKDPQPFLDAIEATKPYRDAYIELVERIAIDDYFEDEFVAFAEAYKLEMDKLLNQNYVTDVKCFLLHELAIYTIAILWKQSEFAKIRNIVQRTYFAFGKRDDGTFAFRNFFYSDDGYIKSAKNTKDGKNYISASTKLWGERINEKYKAEQFAFADTLIFNLDILFAKKDVRWYWFPRSYILSGTYGIASDFWRFARGLVSLSEIKRLSELFGTSDVSALKTLIKKIEVFQSDGQGSERYGYTMAYHNAPLITDSIKIEEIGTLK